MKKTKLSSPRILIIAKAISLSLSGLLLLPPAFAQNRKGPGSSGGTNEKNGELVEFQRANKEILIDDPKIFEGIYSRLNPKLERLEYLMPGVLETLEVAFKKPWIITDEVFPPRAADEEMQILQDSTSVKVNYAWLLKASPEKLERAWLHEIFRAYAQVLSNIFLQKDTDEKRQLAEDNITETLTVLIYNDSHSAVIKKVWTETLRKEFKQQKIVVGGRSDTYQTIEYGRLDQRFADFCNPDVLHSDENIKRLVETFDSLEIKNRYYSDSFRKFNPSKDNTLYFSTARSYRTFPSYIDYTSIWGFDIHKSVLQEAVSDFAILTTSILEGIPVYIENSPRSEQKLYVYKIRFAIDKRVEQLKMVCTQNAKILKKIFAEYHADKGIVLERPTGKIATSVKDLESFFKKTPEAARGPAVRP